MEFRPLDPDQGFEIHSRKIESLFLPRACSFVTLVSKIVMVLFWLITKLGHGVQNSPKFWCYSPLNSLAIVERVPPTAIKLTNLYESNQMFYVKAYTNCVY